MTNSEIMKAAMVMEAINPKAFPNKKSAYESLHRDYIYISTEEATTAIATGGYIFTKDGEGNVELWVNPLMVFEEFMS